MDRNVVLLCLDSARADVFQEVATRLSKRTDVRFSQCRAGSSWSAPSHATMFTGSLPHQHGVHTHDKSFTDLDRSDTFLGELPGYTSIGISANVFISSAYGFDRWFDQFSEVSTGRRFTNGIDPNAFYVDSERTGLSRYLGFLRAALGSQAPIRSLLNGVLGTVNVLTRDASIPKLLDDGATTIVREAKRRTDSASEPYFLFANLEDTHIPHRPVWGYDRELYDAPWDWSTSEKTIWEVVADIENQPEYLRRFRELYAASTDYVDRTLDSLVEYLLAESERETTVIVTADHGENLGTAEDERLLGHKSSLSEGVLHVPFVLINPPEGYASHEPNYFSHLDLSTLIPALARGETPDVFRERVPAEIIGMSPGPDPPAAYDYWDRAIRCVYEGERKWVWDSLGEKRRFSLDRDRPSWQRLLEEAATVPDWANEMFDASLEETKQRAQSASESVDVSESTEQRLEDLGYK